MTSSHSKPFVFVLMPFNDAFTDIYKLGIKKTAEEAGLRAERVDEQLYSESMLERIYRQIDAADIIVADMTGQNPNVFYEVGYVHAKGKLCILLTQNTADIPFDLKQHRHIVYGGQIVKLQSELAANLQWAAEQVKLAKISGLNVQFQVKNAEIERDKLQATVSLQLLIDIENTRDVSFGEIESVTLYHGIRWEFSQNGQACPKTKSDNPLFAERHQLSPTVRRIGSRGWTQLIVSGRKRVHDFGDTGEPKDEYKLAGRVMARITTATGHFDFENYLDVEVGDIPF